MGLPRWPEARFFERPIVMLDDVLGQDMCWSSTFCAQGGLGGARGALIGCWGSERRRQGLGSRMGGLAGQDHRKASAGDWIKEREDVTPHTIKHSQCPLPRESSVWHAGLWVCAPS